MRLTTEKNNSGISLEWYSKTTPTISILILNLNNADLTIECIQSIWANTSGYKYEIVVIDNGSIDSIYEKLLLFQGSFKLLHLKINRFFGEGNNIGVEFAKGEYIVFMNNDIIVNPGWLEPLMHTFENNLDCGAVGPKFLYPSGLLQEAGALLDIDGTAIQIGKFQDPNLNRFNRQRVVDYVSAATILLKKSTFIDLGGFDFIYEPAYYEDADLCLKIGLYGLKVFYTPESSVVHHESATTSKTEHGLGLNTIVEVNKKKFISRWKNYLQSGIHPHQPVQANALQINKPKVAHTNKSAAVYTPFNLIPGGGEFYLLSIAETLLAHGYETWLIGEEIFSGIRIKELGKIFNLNLEGVKMTSLEEFTQMEMTDLFFTMGNEVVPQIPGYGKTNYYVCQFPFPHYSTNEIEKQQNLSSYEAYVVYSDFTRENILKQLSSINLPIKDINIIAPPVNLYESKNSTCNSLKTIITVGRFFIGGHTKNQLELIRAFKTLYELDSSYKLYIVGTLGPRACDRDYLIQCQEESEDMPIEIHLDATKETLESLYANSSIYWHGSGLAIDQNINPEQCEHFGITVIEAMSAGLIPFVVSNGGPSYIVKSEINGFQYVTRTELALGTLELGNMNWNEIDQLRKNAVSTAENFSKQSFVKTLERLTLD